MRSPSRHQRPRQREIAAWPMDADPAEQVAERARYVGSPEHKGHWSPGFVPALRSDASECPPELTLDLESNTAALRRAIRAGCVAAHFEDGFPKYVWGRINNQLYEARHMRGPVGTYKAYPLEELETPRDPEGRLHQMAKGELP